MREENVKHFALENGKYQAVVYGDPVHRKDENGAWQDIDNRLYLKNKKGVSVYETENGRISFVSGLSYTTTQSSFFSASSKIPLGTSQAHVMSLSENGYSISFSLVSNICAVSVAEVSNHETRDVSQSTSQIIDNKTSLIYQNAWQNVDLEYLLVSNDVKENIIVKAPSTEYSYSFLLTLDGLIPEQNEAGVIMLRDEITEEVMYYMPAPYMYDAKGETSYDVNYSLVEIKNGNYLLNVTANNEWINDGGRVFPVTIDPTVKTTSAVYDTYISSSVPSGNYGFGEDLLVSSTQTSFMAINMPVLPTGATVTNATFNISYYLVGSGDSVVLRIKQILQPWTEGNLTYNTYSSSMLSSDAITSITLYKNDAPSNLELGKKYISLTELVKDWYAGVSNFGIAFEFVSGVAYPAVIKSYESSTSSRAYYNITYNISALPIEEGIYFVKNSEYSYFMQIDNNDAPNYSTEKAKMELWDFNGEKHQAWQLTYLNNGYYRISSLKSEKALSVQSGKENTNNQSLIQEDYSGSRRQQWKITATSENRYKIEPRSSETYTTDWVMCAGSGIDVSIEGRNVEQRDYIDNASYKDEWKLIPINVQLNTPLIEQKTDMWCWVASAQMLSRTLFPTQANSGNNSVILSEQQKAVYYVLGDDDVNEDEYNWDADPQKLNESGGYHTDVAKAAAFLAGMVDGEITYSAYFSPYKEKSILELLSDGYPIARFYGWAQITIPGEITLSNLSAVIRNLTPETGAHVTVIKGFSWSEEDEQVMYTVYDPWAGGSIVEYTYTEMMFLVEQINSTYEANFWVPSVVKKTYYSEETFLDDELIGQDYSSY